MQTPRTKIADALKAEPPVAHLRVKGWARTMRARNMASLSAAWGQTSRVPSVSSPESGSGNGSSRKPGWASRKPRTTPWVSAGVRVQTE